MKRILSTIIICALLLACCVSMCSCDIFSLPDIFKRNEEGTSENTVGNTLADEKRYDDSGFSTGSGTQDDPFIIYTVEDLKNLVELINGDRHDVFCTASFALGNDIDLQNEEWTPIGISADRDFRGFFNGSGYSIKNFKITTSQTGATAAGLFGNSSGDIRNLTVRGFNINLNSNKYVKIGAIVGNSYGVNSSIYDCHAVSGKVCVTAKTTTAIGGICGAAQETSITKCSSSSTVIGEFNPQSVKNISNTPEMYSGSIVGRINNGSVSYCTSKGEISMNSANYSILTGGIVGSASYSDVSSSSSRCRISIETATGSPSDYPYSGGYAGGICGRLTDGKMSKSYHSGSISAKGRSNYYVGGLAGWLNGDIINSYANSKISLDATGLYGDQVILGAFIGGLAGFAESGDIAACYSTGSIDALFKLTPLFAGGLIGVGYSDVVLSDCLSANNITTAITAYEDAPAIPITLFVGYFSGEYCYDVTLDNCYRATSATLKARFASLSLHANEEYIDPYSTYGLSSCETSSWKSAGFYQSTLGWDENIWNLLNNSLPTLY